MSRGGAARTAVRPTRTLRVAAGIGLAALVWGCDATTRHRVLTFFFDGVPPLAAPAAEGAPEAAAGTAPRPAGIQEHGPFAAKLCTACHDPGATNALVVPADQLCFRCHDLPMNRKYIHGPLASGGCRACHDPHRSPYRYLLISDSDGFCLNCHDAATVAANEAHRDVTENCTTCHDAHMSDNRYLLK